MGTRNREGGLSLVELLVTMVLLAVTLGLAAPGVREFASTMRVRGARGMMLSDMRLARSKAAAENNNWYLTWNLGTNTYSIVDDNDNNGSVGAGELVGTKTVDPRVTVTNGPAGFPSTTLTFFPNGTASASGELTFTDARGVSMGLSVLSSTGIVRAL
jgi:Tfp pilus assembly protein FimT